MSRALTLLAIGACLALPSTPARFTADAVGARACAPFPSERRAVELWSEGRQVATGVWLVDGRRNHLAFRNPLGQPTSILRIADGAIGLELVGVREIVAPDASAVLAEASRGTLAADALAALVLGRLPAGLCDVTADGEGWRADTAELHVTLDARGRVTHALAGELELRRDGREARLTHGSTTIDLVVGAPTPAEVPRSAFRIGAERTVPSVSTTRLGRLAARRLLGL